MDSKHRSSAWLARQGQTERPLPAVRSPAAGAPARRCRRRRCLSAKPSPTAVRRAVCQGSLAFLPELQRARRPLLGSSRQVKSQPAAERGGATRAAAGAFSRAPASAAPLFWQRCPGRRAGEVAPPPPAWQAGRGAGRVAGRRAAATASRRVRARAGWGPPGLAAGRERGESSVPVPVIPHSVLPADPSPGAFARAARPAFRNFRLPSRRGCERPRAEGRQHCQSLSTRSRRPR